MKTIAPGEFCNGIARLLHFSVVEYTRLGRKLGIGTRVAAKILRERAQSAAPAAAGAQSTARLPRPVPANPVRKMPVDAGRIRQGVAAGGRGFWKSFAQAARALGHQITGVFFAIFGIFFLQSAWHVRTDWRNGVDHRHFVVYGLIGILFAYFSITAFVRGSRAPHRR